MKQLTKEDIIDAYQEWIKVWIQLSKEYMWSLDAEAVINNGEKLANK